ncbi:MAG: mechanosensitive ion channel [Gammaproteobacteria bacterium]|nr:mechanosensitive ion channel [Gammaproteobacteria bacterium]
MTNKTILVAMATATVLFAPLCNAQQRADSAIEAEQRIIEVETESSRDEAIRARIENIYSQIAALADVAVAVEQGVVTLSGQVANEAQAQRAIEIASRVEGVVTLQDSVDRTLDIEGNLAPVVDDLQRRLSSAQRALPLFLIALAIVVGISWLGHRLASWKSLWLRVAPNPFLAELLGQTLRLVAFIVGLILALDLLGASALIGTILGGAGVIGLAIGFAVRDTLENYISSIMLSLRQPFRSGDHVIVNDHEGIVVRLTSRATILMTLDGNHLRIPNADVFKAVILNYTRNPERRFTFELGIDANDDPLAAIATGVEAIEDLPFILSEPKSAAMIESVGDSNIVIWFSAWIDQRHTDFGRGRSLAIRAAKDALETNGFTLPEPIYRVRFDETAAKVGLDVGSPAAKQEARVAVADVGDVVLDTRPDDHLDRMISEEREVDGGEDLLDESKPVE